MVPALTSPIRSSRPHPAILVVTAIVAIRFATAMFTSDPLVTLLSLVALIIVGPAIYWLSRPTFFPFRQLVTLTLVGAVVVVPIAVVVEGLIGASGVSDTPMATIVAPIVEESLKLLGILLVIRLSKKQDILRITTLVDAFAAAGAVAIGFAVVEDLLYLLGAQQSNSLAFVFVLRDVLTPFAHPLFTFFSALGIMLATRSGRRFFVVLGLLIAASLHGTFNYTATLVSTNGFSTVTIAMISLLVATFFGVAITVVISRLRLAHALISVAPGVPPAQAASFSKFREIKAYIKNSPTVVHPNLASLARNLVIFTQSPTAPFVPALRMETTNQCLVLWPSPYPPPSPASFSPPNQAAYPPPRQTGPAWHTTGPTEVRWWDGSAYTATLHWNGTAWCTP